LLLIYLLDRSETSQEIADSIPFRELNNFEIESYIRQLLSCTTETELDQIAFGASPTASGSHLVEVLKGQFFIENPADRGIANHFKTTPDQPANYLCYRYTTRQNFGKKAQNKITKSLLQVSEPSREIGVFQFQHLYQDEDTVLRRTTGVVLRLPEAFYLGGTSRRDDQKVAVGIKNIAIPSSSNFQMHNHDFMCGLFLSTDSALNPIVGRLLLVRTSEDFDQQSGENFKRIPEKDFISDVEKFARGKDFLKSETEWLRGSIRNYEPRWGAGRLNTAILSYKRVAKT
jgi:hypothetical protein